MREHPFCPTFSKNFSSHPLHQRARKLCSLLIALTWLADQHRSACLTSSSHSKVKMFQTSLARWAVALLLVFFWSDRCAEAAQAHDSGDAGSVHVCQHEKVASCLRDDDGSNTDLNLCVGIRGNGNWIYSHFPSLARIVEEIGTIDAAAGGSSASVTTYILESIQSNPMIASDELCDMERRARTSFLLKSVEAIDDYLNIANPFTDKGEDAIKWMAESKILERLMEGGDVAKDAIEEVVTYLGDVLISIANPEFFDMVKQLAYDPDLQAKVVADVLNSLLNPLDTVDSPAFFIRPLPLSMAAASPIHDTVGSFYAGYEPADDNLYEYMLDQCSSAGLGLAWKEANETLADNGMKCGELFQELVEDFIDKRNVVGSELLYPSRIDETLGTDTQSSIIAVAVIRDQGITVYDEAKKDYFEGNNLLNLTWDMNFNDIHYGYWGSEDTLDQAEEGIKLFDDLKSQKADFIGQTTWRDILIRSPGEPGLSNGIEGTDDNGQSYVSIGGWPDLTPTQILKASGCNNVVLVSRHVGSGDFQNTVETQLGATEKQLLQLNDLDSASSSWSKSLSLSSGSLCADYIDESDGKVDKVDLTDISWMGPFVTHDDCLTDLVKDAPDMLPVERYKRACHHGLETPSTESAEDDNVERTSRGGGGMLLQRTFYMLLFTQVVVAMRVI